MKDLILFLKSKDIVTKLQILNTINNKVQHLSNFNFEYLNESLSSDISYPLSIKIIPEKNISINLKISFILV
jgi:hypothetical protein